LYILQQHLKGGAKRKEVKMRRVFAVAMMLLLVVSMGAISQETRAIPQIQPVKIELVSVYPDFAGKESITFSPVFSIYNPNNFEVTVDTLEYWLSAEGKLIAAVQLTDDIYVPANTHVRLKDSVTVGIEGLIGEKVFAEGLPILEAMIMTLPLWKTLGGQCIPAPLPGAKDAIEGVLGQMPGEADKMMAGLGDGIKLALRYWTGEEELKKQSEAIVKDPTILVEISSFFANLGQHVPDTVPGLQLMVQDTIQGMITWMWESVPSKGALFTAEGTAYVTSEQGSLEVKYSGLSWQAEAAPEIAGH